MEIITGIIVGSVISIGSILFGRWIGRNDTQKTVNMSFKKAIDLIAEQDFINSCNEFISAFDDALIRYSSKTIKQHANGIYVETLPLHIIAYKKFRRKLFRFKGSETIKELDEAWNKYCDTQKHGENTSAQYDNPKSGNEGIKEARNLAIQNIEGITGFVDKL